MELPEKYNQTLRTISETFNGNWTQIHAPFPNKLFHYTSAGGLIGILSSRSIWLTDLKYMNDMSELQYASGLIGDCISDIKNKSGMTEIQIEFLSRISKSYNPFESGASVFSASFCENGNLLSQWRAYRGQGGGYAIGFDFFHALRLLDKQCALRKVIYDLEQQKELINEVVNLFVSNIGIATANTDLASVTDNFLPAACQSFSSIAGELLFCLKHPEFHEEKEWRLVHFSNHLSAVNRDVAPLNFREYEGNIIPYYSVSFDAAIKAACDDLSGIGFPVREMVIGPTVNSDLNEESLKALMFGLCKDIEPNIKKSEIPLRWL
jgi:hypothetical protein